MASTLRLLLLAVTLLAAATASAAGSEPVPRLAFLDAEGRLQVWSDGQVRLLSAMSVGEGLLAWSPAGDRIAFVASSLPDGKRPLVLRLFRTDGSGDEAIELPRKEASLLLWRTIEALEWPAPERIAVAGSIDPSTLEMVTVDPTAGKILAAFAGKELAWSPDGKSLAAIGWVPHFAPSEAKAGDRVEIDGGVVFPPGGSDGAEKVVPPLLWSPEGRSLAFVVRRGERLEAVAVDREKKLREIPLADEKRATLLAWSEDGGALLLDTGARLLRVDVGSGRVEEVAGGDPGKEFAPFLRRRERQAIVERLGAEAGAWWPAASSGVLEVPRNLP